MVRFRFSNAVVGASLALGCLAGPALLVAQSNTQGAGARIVIGQAYDIPSKALGEERSVWIHTPPGYSESNQVYPVLYLLDGQAHFQHVAGIMDFLSSAGRVPPMILAAVPNVPRGRTRDFTPRPTNEFLADGVTRWQERWPTAGGADAFHEFLVEELIPYVDRNYRTVPLRILVGHSLGGLFTVHAFVSDPAAFRAYIVMSPSLWWDQQQLVHQTNRVLQDEEPAAFVYVTAADEGGAMLASAEGFAAALDHRGTDSLRRRFVHMEEESHVSVPHRSIYDGLEWMFEEWRFTPGEGADYAAATRLEDIDRRFAEMSRIYGYRIPASEPFLNAVGYEVLRRGDQQNAVAIFAEVTGRFPASANAYDSLGDAHRAAGNLMLARDNYAKAHRLARATGHPNTAYYKQNLDDVTRQLTAPSATPSP